MDRCCPRVVLLDLDGTVIDTMGEYTREAARLISEATGMSLGEAERLYRETMGMSFRKQLQAVGVPRGRVEEVASRFEEWKRRLISRLNLDRRVVEAITLLRRHGLKVYISTNNECRVVEELIPQGLVDGVLCNIPGSGVEKGRPHLEEVARREGVEPCQVVFIGDSSYDIGLYAGLGVRTLRTRGLWADPGPVLEVLRLKEECEAD